MHFVCLILWAACVCLAVFGYGSVAVRLLRLERAGWALAGCVGIALLILLGGVLELLSAVRPPVVIAVVLLGGLAAAEALWRLRKERASRGTLAGRIVPEGTGARILFAVVLLLACVRMAGNLEPHYFNWHDDLAAYLTFPAEMLQCGSLPSDPFSERRIESALGAPYFLQTLMMLCGDPRTVRFLDWGLGSVLYPGVMYGLSRRLRIPVWGSLLLAVLTFLIPFRRQNATMVVLPSALFGALFLVQLVKGLDEGRRSWVRFLLTGWLAGAICTLKSTYIPAAVLIPFLFWVATALQTRRPQLVGAIVCGATALLCMAPWMIDQKIKEGTYLFPVFGKGYEASAYGVIPLPSGTAAWAAGDLLKLLIPLSAPFLVAVGWQLLMGRQRVEPSWLTPTAYFVAIMGGIAAVGLATGGDSIGRYTMPFVAPGMLVSLVYALRWLRAKQGGGRARFWSWSAVAFSVIWVAMEGVHYGVLNHAYRQSLMDLGLPPSASDPMSTGITSFDPQVEQARLERLQNAVPPGQPILEHLFVAYGLDFRRNPIFVADYPGLAGPAPGFPIGSGPCPVREYLLAHGIRYVAFSYRQARFFDMTPQLGLQQLIKDPKLCGRLAWPYLQNKVSVDVQANLDCLASQYRRVYDDGQSCVFDLASPAGSVERT